MPATQRCPAPITKTPPPPPSAPSPCASRNKTSRRICRKTDRVSLVILVWVYFFQIFDKSVLAYGATYVLKEDTGLKGSQYSLVGSMAAIAQLAWQPFSSFLIVKACMAASKSFGGLLATRFFLGLFEAGCLPLFSIITSQWYRRAEQPIRVAAALSYGLGHIKSDLLKEWQIIFLFAGLITIISAPVVYWKLDYDIPSARFLTEDEKLQEQRRVRNGKEAKVVNHSMQEHYHDIQPDNEDAAGEGGASEQRLGQNAFKDLTDRENDEFVYIN